MSGDIWQVTAPHYCAGIAVRSGTVREAAPILCWTAGKSLDWMRSWCAGKGYGLEKIEAKGEVL